MDKVVAFLVGAFISRWHGGGWGLPGPRWLKEILWAIPFTIFLCFPSLHSVIPPMVVLAVVLSFCVSLAGIATGHGRGQSLKEPLQGSPEKVEVLTLWALKLLPVYWYKVFVLTICGLARISGGVAAAILLSHWLAIPILMLGGLGTPLAYMMGWEIYPHENGKGIPSLNQATQIGEFLSGGFAYLALAVATQVL